MCEQVYLGPDIGMASIMTYNDNDGSCTISMTELSTVCSAHVRTKATAPQYGSRVTSDIVLLAFCISSPSA